MKSDLKLLTKSELKKVIARVPEWKMDSKQTKLTKTFDFDKHIDGLIFIARISVNAEILKHHPDIHFTYAKVKITVTTHEMNGLTKRDLLLVQRIENISQTLQVDKNE